MKYIITESKLEKSITNYFYELFPIDNINSTHPYEYNDETGEEGDDETRVEFYIDDYGDEETCFWWYDCEYFSDNSPYKGNCPLVTVEYIFENQLNGYFGEMWQEPFKKWFTENFDLPVKSVE